MEERWQAHPGLRGHDANMEADGYPPVPAQRPEWNPSRQAERAEHLMKPELEQFMLENASRIVLDADCILWTYWLSDSGYGKVEHHGKPRRIHRLAFEMEIGPIEKGMVLDHLCRRRNCFNPYHLQPVTNKTNCRRGDTGIKQRIKTHCPQGHPYDHKNTRHGLDKRGWMYRHCKTCDRLRASARRNIKHENAR